MYNIKAIPTEYKGVTFRSRLEARWAVFFDEIGVKWKYEPKTFYNECDQYTPDFYLENVNLRNKESKGVYIEIKPYSYKDISKYESIGEWIGVNYVLFSGEACNFIWDEYDSENGYQLNPGWDNYMRIHKCSNCGQVKIEFCEGGYNHCDVCNVSGCNHELMDSAVNKYISYNFDDLLHSDFLLLAGFSSPYKIIDKKKKELRVGYNIDGYDCTIIISPSPQACDGMSLNKQITYFSDISKLEKHHYGYWQVFINSINNHLTTIHTETELIKLMDACKCPITIKNK